MSRRNFAIRKKTSTRTRAFQVLAGVLVLSVLTGLYFVRSGDTLQNNPSSDTSKGQALITPAGQPAYTGPTRDVTVYVDGWSLATLGTSVVKATVGSSTANLNFSALDADEVRALTGSHPLIVADALSRLVSADQRLSCTTSGCSIAGKSFDASVLAEPAKIDAFGYSYAAWEIKSGLYAATISIPDASDFVTFSSPGYEDFAASFGVTAPEGKDAANALTGTRVNAAYLGFSFGVIHPIEALWRDDSVIGKAISMERRDVTGISDTDIESIAGVLSRGPGFVGATGPAGGLTPSQLTFLSSPTTGCGPVPVCTPLPLQIDRAASTESYKVCNKAGKSGVLVLSEVVTTVPFTKATHTAGSWSGISAEKFEGASAGSSVVGYTGRPPLTAKTVKLYSFEGLIVDDRGIAAVIGGRDTVPFTDLSLKPADLFNGDYRTCS